MVTYGLENVYNEYTMHFSTIYQRNHSISKIKIKIIIISIICEIIFDMVSQLQILTPRYYFLSESKINTLPKVSI